MKPPRVRDLAALRRAAETRLQARSATRPSPTEADERRLQHELEVHQIELELQNEELHAAHAASVAALERFTDHFDFAPVGYFNLTAAGTIRLVNLTGASMVGGERGRLLGQRFGLLVAAPDRPTFSEFLARVFATEAKQTCELAFEPAGRPPLAGLLEATRAPDGQECRAVLVDITARKRADDAWHQSEDRYRLLVEESPDGIGIYQEGKLVFVNAAGVRQVGAKSKEELLGRSIEQIVHPDDQAAALDRLRRRLAGETGVYPTEARYMRLDGTVLPVEVGATPIRYRGKPAVQFLVRDITARKAAEAVRREREEWHRTILRTATDGYWRVDRQGRLLEVNEAYCRMSGYGESELLTLSISDLEAAETPADTAAHLKKILAQGEDRFESQHRRKDGSVYPVEVSVQYQPTGGGGLVVFLRDITARKSAEVELRKLNRALRAIGACNQCLIHATDETELLNQICHIVVTVGGYRMAWVGFAEQDEARTVRPVAQAGYEAGYLETAQITWADRERGRGPVGTAIRTAQPCLAPGVRDDPLFAPWRAEALKRGYTAVLALPLKTADRVLGALNIYSAALGTFDAGEIELLTQLADDLSFGLQTLRLRRERAKSEAALWESEARYRRIVETAEEGIWKIDAAARTTFVNPKMAQLLGYTVAEMQGRALQDFMDEAGRAIAAANLERRQQGIAEQHDFRFRRKDGSTLWALLATNPITDATGAYAGALAMVTDITARKAAEMALRASESSLKESQKIAGLGSYVLDIPTGQWRSSDVLDQVLGIDGAYDHSVAGWVALIHPDDRTMMADYFANEVLGRGQPFDKEYRIIRLADQAERWVGGLGRLEFDAQGRPRMMRGTIQDITARKAAEQKLAESREQLRALLTRLQRAQEAERIQVAREIHDELGQLLTGLKMDVRWLERKLADPSLPPACHPLLDRAVAASELADQTLLVVQKIAAELRPGALDRLGLGAALQQKGRHFHERTGIQCQVVVAESAPALPTELVTELYYICQEALTNVARHAQATEVRLRLETNAAGLVLEVCDNGGGMAAADFTAPQSLGLLGMRERAAHCGGTITWERGEPRGTRVTVRVPRSGAFAPTGDQP